MNDDVKKLIRAYDKYIELISESEANLIGIAYAHGCRVSQEMIDLGVKLRNEIESLKEQLGWKETS